MITIKQILEETDYSNDDHEMIRGLQELSDIGLFEESKIPMIKRSLKKNVNEMTNAEKKIIQESLDTLVSYAVNESTKAKGKEKDYPTDRELPTVIILKRMAIRSFPDNQKIAMYYSQALDKYISIPYDKNNKALGMQISEAGPMVVPAGEQARTIMNPVEVKNILAKQEKLKKLGGSSSGSFRAGVKFGRSLYDALRKTGTLSSQQIADFVPPEEPKQASPAPEPKQTTHRERMQTMPKPPANRPVRIREDSPSSRFRKMVEDVREQKQLEEGLVDTAAAVGDFVAPGVMNIGRKAMKGEAPSLSDVGNAALDVGTAAVGLATGGAGAAAIKGGVAGMRALSRGRSISQSLKIGSRVARKSTGAKVAGAIGRGVAGLAGAALSSSDSKDSSKDYKKPTQGGFDFSQAGRAASTASNPTQDVAGSGNIASWRQQQKVFGGAPGYTQASFGQFQEQSNIEVMKMIVEENLPSREVSFGETTVTINNRIAKKFMLVYESLNNKNKKKMEKMLNENASSFRKVINFVVRH
jgi:hypothetical protein